MLGIAKSNSASALLISCVLVVTIDRPLKAEDKNVSFCQLLDTLHSARNHSVTVTGELFGNFRHGSYLAPTGSAEICPGWPAWVSRDVRS